MSQAVATAHLSGASRGRNVEYFSLHLLNQKSRCPLQLVFWLMSVILISHSRYYLLQIFPFSETKLVPHPFFFVNKDSLKHSHAHYTSAVTCYNGRVRQFKHKALCSYCPALYRKEFAELWFKARRYRDECALFCKRPLLHHLRETKMEKARVTVGKPLCRI